ncbi:hypothetical protein Pmar_PMAR006674 [Perkinsus marinus ATCC 50983]|uniref:CCHC-type domain-containing protein n=2 Tax=Perkinsus marinus (strain ATCC 50983 / TXsc) TaxID=423536 RepID=C5LLY0_PERM5|nr:hypothetical protein Pmar_PMAR006674 [Perkinsus marinus ATCC 50983]EER02352.1 hypothetical protein Pmar_PMAR006674 [Perkinsus marinus ATCC 50983]|eukprot:XP_002769634.1 hypothetical protein Pmar_PMAR006674 [Perkinsus marinus ATCC 50983]
MTETSVTSSGGEGGKTDKDQQHGAPPGILVSQTSSALFSAALRDAARSTLGNEGFSIHSPALENLFFIGTNGSKLGVSLSGFSSAWNLPPHHEAYYDATLWNAIKPKTGTVSPRFTYERFTRTLSLSLSECVGNTAPIRLYAYCGFLPRPIADTIKTALLSKVSPDGTAVDGNSDVLVWRQIQKITFKPKDEIPADELRVLYQRYVDSCQGILNKADAQLKEVQELELPNLRHPLNLLKQWASLPQAIEHGDSLVRTLERERRIQSRLASHPSGVILTWATRRLLYGALLRATPLFHDSDIGFAEFIDTLEHSAQGDPDTFLTALSKLAKRGGYCSIDKFLKLKGRQQQRTASSHPPLQGRKRSWFDTKKPTSSARSWFAPQPQGPRSYFGSASSSTDIKKQTDVRQTPPPPPAKRQLTSTLGSRQPSKKPVTCYRCGREGHFAYACPSRKDSKSDSSVELTPRPNVNKLSAKGVTPSTAVSLQITHSLLTSHLRVLAEQPNCEDEVVRVAFDTMSSVNLLTVSLAQRLGCSIISDETRLTSLGNQSSPGKATNVRFFIVDKGIVKLHCLVVDDDALQRSCDCEALVGFRDLERIGVQVSTPRSVHAPAPTDAPWSLLESTAVDYLHSKLNQWCPLVGAPLFSSRLRPLSSTDHATSTSAASGRVHDFSPGLLAKLSTEAQILSEVDKGATLQ